MHRRVHLWVSLVVGLVVWGLYFFEAARRLSGQDAGGRPLILLFLAALVCLVAVEAGATALIGRMLRRRARALDEGPSLDAALRAGHVALMLLIGLVLATAAALALAPVLGSTLGWRPDLSGARGQAVAAHVLLAFVVVTEGVRAALTLALLPRR